MWFLVGRGLLVGVVGPGPMAPTELSLILLISTHNIAIVIEEAEVFLSLEDE